MGEWEINTQSVPIEMEKIMGKMQCSTWLKKQIFEWYIYVCLIGRCNYVGPRGSLMRAGAKGVRITDWICTKAHSQASTSILSFSNRFKEPFVMYYLAFVKYCYSLNKIVLFMLLSLYTWYFNFYQQIELCLVELLRSF